MIHSARAHMHSVCTAPINTVGCSAGFRAWGRCWKAGEGQSKKQKILRLHVGVFDSSMSQGGASLPFKRTECSFHDLGPALVMCCFPLTATRFLSIPQGSDADRGGGGLDPTGIFTPWGTTQQSWSPHHWRQVFTTAWTESSFYVSFYHI